MAKIYATVTLRNGEDVLGLRNKEINEAQVRKLEVQMLVDSESIMMAINEDIKSELGLQSCDKDYFLLANGETTEMEITEPIEVRFENRRAMVQAFVLPGNSEPLLGDITMSRMDVQIDNQSKSLIVNPLHPIRPQFSMK